MSDREEFLAYLQQASKIVEGWPAWKKSGLNAPATATKSMQERTKVPQQYKYATQSGNAK